MPALEEFFGSEAGLFSAATIARLTEQWHKERELFMARDLCRTHYVYVWVDGIHTGVRLGGDSRLCCLVIEAAEGRWRKLTGAHLVALVRAGAEFRNGELLEPCTPSGLSQFRAQQPTQGLEVEPTSPDMAQGCAALVLEEDCELAVVGAPVAPTLKSPRLSRTKVTSS